MSIKKQTILVSVFQDKSQARCNNKVYHFIFYFLDSVINKEEEEIKRSKDEMKERKKGWDKEGRTEEGQGAKNQEKRRVKRED